MPLDRNVRKVEAFSNVPVFRKFLSVKADHRVLSPVCRLSDYDFFSADLFAYHNIRYENYKLYQVVKEGPSEMPCAITQMVDGRLNIAVDGIGANVSNQCTLELGNS